MYYKKSAGDCCKYIRNIGFDIDCFLGGNVLCKKKFKIQVVQITQNGYGFTDSNSHPTRSDSRSTIKTRVRYSKQIDKIEKIWYNISIKISRIGGNAYDHASNRRNKL